MKDRSCGELMEPFLRATADQRDLPTLQIIGGNGSAALLHEETVINLATRTIEAPASCDLRRYRADQSLRDMDTLVLSSDRRHIDRVQELAEDLIGEELMISIFGLKNPSELERQQHQPVRSTARVFLGDRYVACTYDDKGNIVSAEGFKALYPFRAVITAETLDTFELSIAGRAPIPTAHPGATILNYLTRSISGLRAKDAEKVGRIGQLVLSKYPEIRAWIHDGPGRETLDLARVLHTLREPRESPQTLQVGELLQIEPYRLAELVDHEGFMASDLPSANQRALVEMAHAKARLLGRYEAKPAIVTFWHNHVEERLPRIVHNDT